MISHGPTLQMTWSRAETLSIYCRISSDAGEVIETDQTEVKVTTSKYIRVSFRDGGGGEFLVECLACNVYAGAYEPPKVAKERVTSVPSE